MTKRKKGLTLDWVWANREALESHRLCSDCVQTCRPYVSRYLTESRPPALRRRHSFFLPFLFFRLTSYGSVTIGIPPAVRNFSRTLPWVAAILLVSSLANFSFSTPYIATCLSQSPDFSSLLSNLSLGRSCFYFALPLYILSRRSIFSRSLVFEFGFVLSFALSPVLLDLLSSTFFFRPSTSSVASFTTLLFPLATPFSLSLFLVPSFPRAILFLSFYFYLSFASFRIFRIRFSARTLYVSLFHASFPSSSGSSSISFYPSFFSPATTFSNFSRCFAVLDLLWSLIKKNNRKDVIGAANEAEH